MMGDTYDGFLSESSPFVDHGNWEDKAKTGGMIDFGENPTVKWVVVGLVILLCLYIMYNTYNLMVIGKETYEQRMTHTHFNNLHGEIYDEEAKAAIRFGESITEPRAIDHYRLGTTYLVNAQDPKRAHLHFRQALEHVINGNVDMREVPFILDRIDDYKDEFINFPDMEELPIQQALMAHYNAANTVISKIKRQKPDINKDDPDFTQKVMLSRQKWESDSQNVHDSAIGTTIKSQFCYIQNMNATNTSLYARTYEDLKNWIRVRFKEDSESYEKINKVFKVVDNNYPIMSINKTHEQDLITAIWQRTHDPRNANHYNEIRESVCDSIMDCVEGGHVVCMTGRNAKMWQALAYVDFNPQIGIIKNKQTLRNEVYESAAKIVDEFVGTNGTASEQLKESYRKSEKSEQVEELQESMLAKIDELYNKYSGLIPDEQLKLLINECKAVI
jgi:hypothetical protein